MVRYDFARISSSVKTHSGKGVDWWCLGIFLYELNAGFSPFYATDHVGLYSLILRGGIMKNDWLFFR